MAEAVSKQAQIPMADDQAQVAVAHHPSPKRQWWPERWYVHILLWIAIFIIGFPLIYAIIVGTQSNAEVFRFQFSNATIHYLILGNRGRFLLLHFLWKRGCSPSLQEYHPVSDNFGS